MGGMALLLHLSSLRSSVLVGRALATSFPTEESWLAAMNDPALRETLDSFAQLLEEIQQVSLATPEDLLKFGEQHYTRALECVETFAERIGVSPMDLLAVSIHL